MTRGNLKRLHAAWFRQDFLGTAELWKWNGLVLAGAQGRRKGLRGAELLSILTVNVTTWL